MGEMDGSNASLLEHQRGVASRAPVGGAGIGVARTDEAPVRCYPSRYLKERARGICPVTGTPASRVRGGRACGGRRHALSMPALPSRAWSQIFSRVVWEIASRKWVARQPGQIPWE